MSTSSHDEDIEDILEILNLGAMTLEDVARMLPRHVAERMCDDFETFVDTWAMELFKDSV